nr:unnamed protein product [Digitaria exilis]
MSQKASVLGEVCGSQQSTRESTNPVARAGGDHGHGIGLTQRSGERRLSEAMNEVDLALPAGTEGEEAGGCGGGGPNGEEEKATGGKFCKFPKVFQARRAFGDVALPPAASASPASRHPAPASIFRRCGSGAGGPEETKTLSAARGCRGGVRSSSFHL